MSKYAFAAAAALSALIASSAAMAEKNLNERGTAFTVSVTVHKGCVVTTNVASVAFTATAGTASPPGYVDGTAQITCTSGTEYDVSLVSDNGFKMKNGDNAIAYTVASGTTTLSYSGIAPTSANKVTNTSAGSAQEVPLRFSIAPGAWGPTKPAVDYSDTVTLRIDY